MLAADPGTPAELLALAVEVAEEAATVIARERATGVEVADTKSSVTDVVTRVDRVAEQLIHDRLSTARPGDAFVGEEGGADEGASGVRWIVDPIDGTVNFLYGLPRYAVSIAAEVDGTVVAGVVRDVPSGTTYTATLGGGAFRDSDRLAVRGPAPMAERLVLTGFSYRPEVRRLQAEGVARLLSHVRDIRRIGSAALDLCHVAEGSADGYVEEGVHLWDHAAAGLVAREAGARTRLLTGVGGLSLMVCAPAHGFDELFGVVSEVGLVGDGSAAPEE
ncbi:MAG: inositol monophosphatase family protein [Nocardioides sp.]